MSRILIAISLFVALFTFLPAASALAEDAPVSRVSMQAPSALYVDGVKVGSTLAQVPKQATVRTSRCSSGCTLMITN